MNEMECFIDKKELIRYWPNGMLPQAVKGCENKPNNPEGNRFSWLFLVFNTIAFTVIGGR